MTIPNAVGGDATPTPTTRIERNNSTMRIVVTGGETNGWDWDLS
jgi:hypothetical protein